MTDNKWASIGGSDIAVLMGVHPSRAPIDIWLRIQGLAPEIDSPILRRGRVLEKYLRELAQTELGMPLSGPRDMLLRDLGFPARASLDDGIESPEGYEVVEYKTVSPWARHEWGESGTAEIPLHYYMQVQWYLMAMKARKGHVVALIGLDDLRHYQVRADIKLHQQMVVTARDWWDKYIVGGERPPLEGTALETEWLKRTPQTSEEVLDGEAVEGAAEVFRDLLMYQSERKDAEAAEESAKNWLREKIGSHKGMRFANGSVSWSAMSERYATDWESVAKELGADEVLIGKHTTKKPSSRVFRVQTRDRKS